MGGVESHLYHLSHRLVQRGHRVIIITHAYKKRIGVRYLTSGVKVYYLPLWQIYDQVVLPTLYGSFPLFRNIFLRENIHIVHGHQAFSPMCHEGILCARTMGLKTCFTDHSLFGFEDTSSILTNKLLKFTLSDIDHVICVSYTSKENTVLRAALDPVHVSVIPNAVVAAEFTPDPTKREPGFITIVVASRLVYRKGVDLLVSVIPQICRQFEDVKFIIAGDGPKRVAIEQMREKFSLQDRVSLVGAISHSKVRDVLVQGHIFLNTSLTEAFCIAIVEAASCGLLVVSTRVGGVPEVLPDHLMLFAEPDTQDLVDAVTAAIGLMRCNAVDPFRSHNEVKLMYSWSDVAERTELVYRSIMFEETVELAERFRRYNACGLFAGKLGCMIIAGYVLLLMLLEWIWPVEGIEEARPWNYREFKRKRYLH